MKQVFILGAATPKHSLYSGESKNFLLHSLNEKTRILDWTINALKEAGVGSEEIYFVGGEEVDKIIKFYPNLNYVVNPKWKETHVVGSLKYAMKSWRGGEAIILFADTLFRTEVFREVFANDAEILAGVDSKWKERIKDQSLIDSAEKVIIENQRIVKAGKEEIDSNKAFGQFTGLLYLNQESASFVNDLLLQNESRSIAHRLTDYSNLSDLLNCLAQSDNFEVNIIDVSNSWTELDSVEDVSRFVFGTKAETLHRIKPMLKNSIICNQIHFNLREWNEEKSNILNKIQNRFGNTPIIIRSSSTEEDSWDSSQAGAFLSIADVDPSDRTVLDDAIKSVVKVFSEKGQDGANLHNQVLIQPFIKNVEMSGVVFTQSLESGAPYFTINYDDVSGKTDTITSGSNNEHNTVKIFEGVEKHRIKDVRLRSLMIATEELVHLLGYKALDIEFVLTKKKELYIVQVRPITIRVNRENSEVFESRMLSQAKLIESRLKPKSNIFGNTSILADMPDWNPAEMIGTRPTPLAFSLYEYLITNSTWRIARAKMGYNDPQFERLMFMIGGHPYIDVRNSFNNLIPQGLDAAFCDKLINYYLQKLKENPALHDKVEFEIVVTCFAPDVNEKLAELKSHGFTDSDLEKFKIALKTLTEGAVTERVNSIDELIAQTESIQEHIQGVLRTNPEVDEIPGALQYVLDDCIENGTIPFSILARNGFIASSFLRGFVATGVISEEEKNTVLKGIETVAGDLVSDMNSVKEGSKSVKSFLTRYGHLRPGSYDITSLSYEEAPEYYFTISEGQGVASEANGEDISERVYRFDHFKQILSEESIHKINKALLELNLSFDANTLLTFVEKATWAREFAKFNFSKSLNQALKMINRLGEEHGFTREEMSYVRIEDLINLGFHGESASWKLYLKEKTSSGKLWYNQVNAVETASVITGVDDLFIVEEFESKANYVTTQSVSGEIFVLNPNSEPDEMDGKIVVIEGADPGFDWIFMHPIAGLITKYGGAASHMTIRCAEFGLPAAIGCGPDQYDKVVKSKKVELNCLNKKIICLV